MNPEPIRVPTKTAAFALVLATFATSCATSVTDIPYSDVELTRRIVDVTTGHAIPNAMVVFKWNQSEGDIGHGSRTFCVRVEMLHADSDGRYRVPSWSGRGPMIAVIYKPGYTRIDNTEATRKGIDMMTRAAEGFPKRSAELSSNLLRCTNDEDRKLLELFQAIHEEARSVAQTAHERRAADRLFLAPAEAAQFGREEATRRALGRERQ